MTTLIAIILIFAFSMLFTAALRASGTGPSTYPQKRPILGGSDPETHAWQRFHVRYYTMTLLFVAFEMEMMFMYPWAVVFVEEGPKALAEMGMFLVILSVGIVYGWREGIFRWE
ncbi:MULTISPECIES: NADH-quinone oxidoreductase subunit A [Sulfitobacter]|jgi:NADH-quinone oxidoreductase subunit A|uniref:NADH-quinone oxidoreductase subunit n=1 Tax=Sulfitobacter pontiacus TaxID=60137 RepID=A0A1H3D2V1_9RHOB|nr:MULTISPECIES: NADH-quinone oxidoreductase subunit A [Sulfitobacter]KZY52094.1 NADH dehydrogenase [Sulfitobacter sp. HI0054]MBO9440427.1 NADH-quinone oxidoreductase subunit A [Sulfitobacter sp. R18_2]TKA84140.1 NADH-quinone oxidoreductase subunit A [Sulfitobacter sp. 15WGC]SDX60717.1 NADH dehydrogenase subunit A [Sulfitobacter pontiacus]|tara:strand:- start:353 stop:694 length:342 start_codon:yes stop_codon:yes gene_type:complete